jgi:hypothetical protein
MQFKARQETFRTITCPATDRRTKTMWRDQKTGTMTAKVAKPGWSHKLHLKRANCSKSNSRRMISAAVCRQETTGLTPVAPGHTEQWKAYTSIAIAKQLQVILYIFSQR